MSPGCRAIPRRKRRKGSAPPVFDQRGLPSSESRATSRLPTAQAFLIWSLLRWTRSSAGEHLVHTEGVTGSIPVASTTFLEYFHAHASALLRAARWLTSGLKRWMGRWEDQRRQV